MATYAADCAARDRSIAAELSEAGFAICEDYWPRATWHALAKESQRLRARGGFRAAGVGRGQSFRVRPEIRSDRVCWIEPEEATRRQRAWLDRMEALRRTLNETLFLGLFGFEGHLAVYPPGSFYRAHLDRFEDASHRTVSVILYLNEDWRPEQGGALRLHLEAPAGAQTEATYRDVAPSGGTLVCFLSADLRHEVLVATRERWSVVGWFSTRQ